MESLVSRVPMMVLVGNHDIETQGEALNLHLKMPDSQSYVRNMDPPIISITLLTLEECTCDSSIIY